MQKRNLTTIIVILSVILLSGIGILLLAQRLLQYHFNSDSLYLFCVYKDIFIDHYSLSTFVLSPSPCFFPDMTIFFTLMRITPGYVIGYYLYGIAYFSLWSFFIYLIGLEITYNKIVAQFYAVLLTFVFVICLSVGSGITIAKFILDPGRHAGLILPGLAITWLTVSILQQKGTIWHYAGIIIIVFLTAFSDISILPQFLVPLFLSFSLLTFLQKFPKRHIAFIFLSYFLSTYGARLFLSYCNRMEWLIVPSPKFHTNKNLSDIWNTLLLFSSDMYRFFVIDNSILLIFFVIAIIFSIVSLFNYNKTKIDNKHLLLFLIAFVYLSILFTIAGPIITGLWMSLSERRYIMPLIMSPFWIIAWLLIAYHYVIPRFIRISLPFMAMFISLYLYIPPLMQLKIEDYQLPYPADVQFMDNLAQKYNLQYGYSDYWNANYMTFFSRHDLRVNQLHKLFIPYYWINNKQWYWKPITHEDHFPVYEYIITNRLPKDKILTCFGKPAFIKKHKELEVYIYNRKDDYACRNFLRFDFLNKRHPYSHYLPVSPKSLQQYCYFGTFPLSKNHIILKGTNALHIQYSPNVEGNILEISTSRNQEFFVHFYARAGDIPHRPIGNPLKIPSTKGEGMMIHYLNIPEAIVHRGFTSVVVSPADNKETPYSIGHAYIYFDTLRNKEDES